MLLTSWAATALLSGVALAAPKAVPKPVSAPQPFGISNDGSCGANGKSCFLSIYGGCCSQYGYCGSSADYCGTGCQAGYGTCSGSLPGSSKVSPDGSCGGSKGYTCKGSRQVAITRVLCVRVLTSESFGNCCSQYGWCGSTTDYCSTGCNSAFGTCTSTAPPKPVSPFGTCGGLLGYTCKGSIFGDCCSR
jgi:hypothetical protein